MMIRVNGEYLDFDDEIEIESQIKLFEDIETSNGDFSYTFSLSKTSNNLSLLGLPFPDTVKSIYQNVDCEIIDDSGFKINRGSLKVERITSEIECTFFGGNTEWFGLLTEPMSSLPLYKYDYDLTVANIQNSWTKNEGLVCPILDTGALVSRSYANLKVEDFIGAFYVKTLFKEIFNAQGIKLEGDLLNDDLYNSVTVVNNGRSQDDVDARSSYVKKTTAQSAITTLTKVTFQDETNFPYFDGSLNNFSGSTYTPDIKMVVDVNVNVVVTYSAAKIKVYIYKNGASIKSFTGGSVLGIGANATISGTMSVPLEAGDTLEIYTDRVGGVGNFSVDVNSTIKITPTYLYAIFGSSSVPRWTQGEFVSNVIRVFNVLPSYNADTKTLTLDLFNKLKDKEPIDVSDDIEIIETDFSEFISDYAKVNTLKYHESDEEDLREYNVSNFISYGSGEILANNDFIDNNKDIVESDFTSPITYLNIIFDMSMERFNFVELEEIESKNITSVTDSSDTPRFNITNADNLFTVGDLVRIVTGADSDYEYEGDWVVNTVTSSYITVNGAVYGTSADGAATLLRHKFTTDNNVYLFVNVPNKENLFYSSNYSMTIENTSFTSASLAYFNLLSNGRQISTKYKQSLSLGEVNNPLSIQKTIIETYWGQFSRILNDPVMLRGLGYFDKNKFTALKTFLRPLRIKTNQTNNLYYLNRITGYKGGSKPCEPELIKLP